MNTLFEDRGQEDAALASVLSECARGSTGAFSELYTLTNGSLRGSIRRIVSDEHSADDVLQRGYLSVWQKAHTYNSEKGRALSWLRTIMRNHAIDELRKSNRYRFDETICETIHDDRAGPSEQTETTSLSVMLEAHIGQLPSGMAHVIRQRFLHGLSSVEIARDLKMPVNTVRCWMRRGLERLRRNLPIDSLQSAITLN